MGETGGKDFIIAHPSADPAALAVAMARGGFEYQGQKCSAPSRVYVPKSLWPEVRDRTAAIMEEIRVGDVADFRNFMGAVIDSRAFAKIGGYLEDASRNAIIVAGGQRNGEVGWFVQPTLVVTTDPGLMAPIAQGQRVGTVTLTAPDFPTQTLPVYAAQAVPRAGLASRLWGKMFGHK